MSYETESNPAANFTETDMAMVDALIESMCSDVFKAVRICLGVLLTTGKGRGMKLDFNKEKGYLHLSLDIPEEATIDTAAKEPT